MAPFMSGFEVRVLTDKPCKRCHGKGWAQWGSLYGPCYRCGGESGKESRLDIPATLAAFEKRLAEIKADGEAAKAQLETAVGVLNIGRARRDLERARRQYGEILTEQRRFIAHHTKEVA